MGAWLSLWWTPANRKVILTSGRKLILANLLGEGGFSFVYLVNGLLQCLHGLPIMLLSDPYTGEQFALKKTICQTEEQLEVRVYILVWL